MTGNSLPPVLLLGTESSIGLAILRELGRHQVPVHGVGRSPNAIGRYSRYCTNHLTRGQGPLERWLPRMIEETGARALIAYSETDLIALSAMPDRIAGCEILTARAGPLQRVLDKARTIEAARAVGIEVPIDHQNMPDHWPVVLKWADPPTVIPKLQAAGLDWHKTEYCRDAAELDAALARYAPLGLRPLVQSYAPGRGIAQMFYREGGRTTLFFQHEQLNEWPPEGGIASLCRALPAELHQTLRAKSEALLDAIGWEGPAMVEYRHDSLTGRSVFMEVNGRFWGSQPLATAAGAQFAWELYHRCTLGEAPSSPPYRPGIKARMIAPECKRLARLFFQPSKIADPFFKARPWRDLIFLFVGFVDPEMHHYIFAWDDPMPVVADLIELVKRCLHTLSFAFRRNRGPAQDTLPIASPSAD